MVPTSLRSFPYTISRRFFWRLLELQKDLNAFEPCLLVGTAVDVHVWFREDLGKLLFCDGPARYNRRFLIQSSFFRLFQPSV